MRTSHPTIRCAYEDYKSLAASSDRRYSSVLHQLVSTSLAVLLWQHARATRSGYVLEAPLDVVLGEGGKIDVFSLGPHGYASAAAYGRGDRLTSEVVPGFQAALEDVFPPVP